MNGPEDDKLACQPRRDQYSDFEEYLKALMKWCENMVDIGLLNPNTIPIILNGASKPSDWNKHSDSNESA